jgi:hypothetical protein
MPALDAQSAGSRFFLLCGVQGLSLVLCEGQKDAVVNRHGVREESCRASTGKSNVMGAAADPWTRRLACPGS